MPKTAISSETPANKLPQQSIPTFCEECDHVLREFPSQPEWGWLCLKHPRLDGHGFVSKTIRDGNLPPYLRCKDVNGGYCYLYAPKRQLKEELNEDR